MINRLYLMLLLLFLGCRTFSFYNDASFVAIEKKEKSWSYFYQGLRDEEQENWVDAVRNFKKSLQLSSGEARIHVHLAGALIHLGKKDRASKHLNRAVKQIKKDDYLLYYDTACIYLELGQTQKAEKLFQQSITIFPDFRKSKEALEGMKSSSLGLKQKQIEKQEG